MKISIIAFGTRGDVQPLIALGKALHARGHRVRVVASHSFSAWITGYGLEAAPSSVDIQALMLGEEGLDWVENGNDPLKQMRAIKRLVGRYGLEMMGDAWHACQDAEVIFSSFTSDVFAASIAERLGARQISTPLQPALVATRSGQATQQAPLPRRHSLINYLFGKWLLEPVGWRLMGDLTNQFRLQTLGLPAQRRRHARQPLRSALVVQGFSSQVVPHPRDWPDNIHTTGYWFLEDAPHWHPPPALVEFLAAGPAPVFVGFGSMTGRDPQRLTRLVVEALARSGQRAVLQAGWAGMGDLSLPPEIFLLGNAPHDWLFPRLSAAVHHGGAGTTGASLRAGVPTVIVPHLADQPFWGARVAALGVGPPPIPRHQLNPANLAAAIERAATDPAMRQRAGELGARIRAEDGIGTAVALIERFLGG